MLTIFFVIVFIAELIVAGKVISVLKDADAKVCEINDQVTEAKPVVVSSMNSVSAGVKSAAKGVDTAVKFLEKKRRSAIISLTKAVAGIVIFLLIKKYPHKRLLTAVDAIYSLDSLLKTV